MFKLKQLSVALAAAFVANVAIAEEITILHVGDQESWLLSSDGNRTDGSYGGVHRLAEVIANATTNAGQNTVIKLNAGDAILPGPRFQASLDNLQTAYIDDGQDFYDAIAMRAIGFDATTYGNHEFDLGADIAARFAEVAGTTYISSNLNLDSTPALTALVNQGKVAPSKVITTAGGKKVAIVGATTPLIPSISSPGAITLKGYDAANTELENLQAMVPFIQAEVDRVRNEEGATMVILMSHLQNSANEINVVVPALRNVDLVVSGGGHELMVDADDLLIPFGPAVAFNSHPIIATDADNKQVPLVTSHYGNRYVGELDIEIDDTTGAMTGINGSRMIRVTNADKVIDDPEAVVGNAVLKASVVDPVQAYVDALNTQVVASTDILLSGTRGTACDTVAEPTCTVDAPGVRNAETGLGNLVADSLRFVAKADVAIQNGGGVRADLTAEAGDVTVGDTFNVLPFVNFVTKAENVNATQLKDVLEHAVAEATPQGNADGQFGHISGMRVIYDTTRTARAQTADANAVGTGERVREVVLDDGTVLIENGAVVNNTRTFSIATIDFLANGGDAYPFQFNNFSFQALASGETYQAALQKYLETPRAEGGLAGAGAEITENMYGGIDVNDFSGRLVDLAIAVSTDGNLLLGARGRNTLVGTAGNDVFDGGHGRDMLTGGPGADLFVLNSLRDAGDTITDFTPYADKVDLSQLLAKYGVSAQTAIADGNIQLQDVRDGVVVKFDTDGVEGRRRARPILKLKGLSAAQINFARDFILVSPF